ncbi:MAG: hypothetical protein WD872_18875 [Pirellulaceae bacterium]
MANKKKPTNSTVKSSVKRRTLNVVPQADVKAERSGLPGHEQDTERRLGNFEGKGEHARVGSRTAGIVGQTKRAFRTDNKRTKSKGASGKPSKSG